MEAINIPAVTKDALKQIFSWQKDLLKYYIPIEGLPNYPVDLEQKANQKVIRDFKERIVGELSEAYEELLVMWINKNDNVDFNEEEHLGYFNEEIADAVHFFVELLIYSGIEAEGIDMFYYKQLMSEPGNQSFYEKENPLRTLFNVATVNNTQQGLSYQQFPKWKGFKMLTDEFVVQHRPDLSGGRFLDNQVMGLHANFLWEITYMLSKAVNNLKNKAWNQSEKTNNTIAYNEGIMETFLHFIRYLEFMGQNEIGMFHAYYRKNQILQKRIQNGY